MHAHYLQHVPFEGLGSIEPWLASTGYEITCTRLFDEEDLPDIHGIDFLVVMGGPMSANDEHIFPWLSAEKHFIFQAIDRDIPVLGICLGAQLIASAMGSSVFPNTVKEIGWFPIQKAESDGKATFAFPQSVEVFHWHGETFDLPSGARLLATSKGCENQAFQIGQRVFGMQFHLETTPASAREIVTHCRDELVPSTYVQSESQILSAASEKYGVINGLMADVLRFITRS